MDKHAEYMRKAIELASENVRNGGGPFGAVVVIDGKVVGEGANSVTRHNDPTAHAEVLAIRDACQRLSTFDLSQAVLYTSCEPCPMCLGAIYWARIPVVYYGNTRSDAAHIGFDDDFIYQEMNLDIEKRSVIMKPLLGEEAAVSFNLWDGMANKIAY